MVGIVFVKKSFRRVVISYCEIGFCGFKTIYSFY